MPAAWHLMALRFQNVEGDEESADLAKKLKEKNATEATKEITVLRLVGRRVCLYIAHQIINPLLSLFEFFPFLVFSVAFMKSALRPSRVDKLHCRIVCCASVCVRSRP